MGNPVARARGLVLLALVLCVLSVPACGAVDAGRVRFDVPAQAAASALNEFAKQADVTLIFSYDLVAGVRTRALKGDFTVDEGLEQLLDGTPLGYRQAVEGTYLVCPLVSCGIAPASADTTCARVAGAVADIARAPVSISVSGIAPRLIICSGETVQS